jgi:hypothetical protein
MKQFTMILHHHLNANYRNDGIAVWPENLVDGLYIPCRQLLYMLTSSVKYRL